MAKECGEEAGIPPDLAATARPVGAVSYLTVSATGYKPDVLFCYDIQLPPDFVPTPQVCVCVGGGWGGCGWVWVGVGVGGWVGVCGWVWGVGGWVGGWVGG